MKVEATCTVCGGRREHEVVQDDPNSDFVWLQCCTCGDCGCWTKGSRDLKEVSCVDRQ